MRTAKDRARDVVAYYQGNADDAPLLVQAIEKAIEAAEREENEACAEIAEQAMGGIREDGHKIAERIRDRVTP